MGPVAPLALLGARVEPFERVSAPVCLQRFCDGIDGGDTACITDPSGLHEENGRALDFGLVSCSSMKRATLAKACSPKGLFIVRERLERTGHRSALRDSLVRVYLFTATSGGLGPCLLDDATKSLLSSSSSKPTLPDVATLHAPILSWRLSPPHRTSHSHSTAAALVALKAQWQGQVHQLWHPQDGATCRHCRYHRPHLCRSLAYCGPCAATG